eukprot:TRINITY_DN16652_c0_g1_i2.p1 TRINITY_DN16652_c0_g1~~TRINITY_DN16652_c0_g1_i2.p1  ORF type:complete len:274 (+),score=39.42 TRINITY_DN16652_c0_g1_i2:384-1205(+)
MFDGERAKFDSESDAFRLGEVVATLHSTDPDWFETFRNQILAAHPGLEAAAPPGRAHWIWQLLARTEKLKPAFAGEGAVDQSASVWPAEVIQRFCGCCIEPRHAVLTRVVCFHGDLHHQNLIQGSEGRYKVVDFEFTGVGPAVVDLCMVLRNSGFFPSEESKIRSQTKMLEGYLKGLGLTALSTHDVEQILLECSIYSFAIWADNIGLFDIAQLSPADALARIPLLEEFVASIRSSAELQSQVVQSDSIQDLWAASAQCASLDELSLHQSSAP